MRILFHYTHKQTLGHTTRSISFAKALADRGADVLILQGGLPQSFACFPQNCKVVNVPLPFDSRTSFQSHASPVSATKRGHFILKTAADFKPDVMITEFFPFGRSTYMPELLPTLRYLKKKNARIISSAGYPLIVDLEHFKDHKFFALKKAVFGLFDIFLIHTPPELETRYFEQTIQSEEMLRSYVNMMKSLKDKIIYTGYILPEKIIEGDAKPPDIDLSNTIIVSRGGGSVFPKIITSAIEAQRYLDNKVKTIITCGPATSSKEMDFFRSFLKPEDKERVFLTNLLSNLHEYFQHCRASVSLCGYNTSVQLMYYQIPSVIIPYENTFAKMPTNDQVARSSLLKEKFSSIVLNCQDLTGRRLAEAIKEQLDSPRPDLAPSDWFNGTDVAAQAVLQDISN